MHIIIIFFFIVSLTEYFCFYAGYNYVIYIYIYILLIFPVNIHFFIVLCTFHHFIFIFFIYCTRINICIVCYKLYNTLFSSMSRRAPIFGNTPHKNCRCSCDCHQHSPSGNSRYFQSITSQNNKNHQQSAQEQRRHRSTSRKRIPIFSKCNKKQRINYLLRAPYTQSITQHQNQNPKQKLYEDNNDKNKTFENNNRKSNISFSRPNTQTQKRKTQNPYHTISYSKQHRIQGLMHPVQLTNLIYKVRLAHYKKAFHYNHL